jgi:NADH-quinone oxidoreductase subunit N
MTVGNVSALVQSNVKRMLAFSSVSHAGFMVLGVLVLNSTGLSAVLFYLVVYSIMNLGAFAIIALVEEEDKGMAFQDYRGFATRYPWLAVSMTLFMVSLAGFPPTSGFVAKYGLLSAAASEGYIWLAIIAVINTLISVYYYLRLVVNMFMKQEQEFLQPTKIVLSQIFVGLLAVIVLVLGVVPGVLLEFAAEAVIRVH